MNKILSIIVPVYNEVKTVLIVLEKLKNLKLYDNYKSQIIVSTIILMMEQWNCCKIKENKDLKIQLLSLRKNMGKGDLKK